MKVLLPEPPECFDRFRFHQDAKKWYVAKVKVPHYLFFEATGVVRGKV